VARLAILAAPRGAVVELGERAIRTAFDGDPQAAYDRALPMINAVSANASHIPAHVHPRSPGA
jgi:hypothetical protein